MQTPRPDRFTYPPHGDSLGGDPTEKMRPSMRAVFLGGLVGALILGLLIGFYR